MRKPRNHFQLKEQENSPEGANNETDLCSLRCQIQKGGNENSEGIKSKYEEIESRYEQ